MRINWWDQIKENGLILKVLLLKKKMSIENSFYEILLLIFVLRWNNVQPFLCSTLYVVLTGIIWHR